MFDIIVSNPPYQKPDYSGTGNGAIPIYPHFVEISKALNPKYIVMIIPAKWYSGGRNLDQFREVMLKDSRIKEIHDIFNSNIVFKGTKIQGGVCYFLWDRDYKDSVVKVCNYLKNRTTTSYRPLLENGAHSFIRLNEAISIWRKVSSHKEVSFQTIVSPRQPFGINTLIRGEEHPFDGSVALYHRDGIGYISRDLIKRNHHWIDKHKIYVNTVYGHGLNFPSRILKPPILGSPNSVCTETYLCVGCSDDEEYVKNIMSYMRTKFFRFLLSLKKNTHQASREVYAYIPMQDFSKSWIDEELYEKYDLDMTEIEIIERSIR